MNKYSGRELSYGVLHAPIFIPGIGQFGPTLSKIPSGTSKGVKMTVDEHFVTLEVADKQGQLVEVAVPLNMFTHMTITKQ